MSNGTDNFYKFYKSRGGKLDRVKLKLVYTRILYYLSRRLIGGEINIPNLKIQTFKYKPKALKYTYMNGEKVTHFNFETEGYTVAIKWRRGQTTLPNRKYYKFLACRGLKREVSKDFVKNYRKYNHAKNKTLLWRI